MFTISLMIISSTLAAPAPPDPAHKAQAHLQGIWRAVGMEYLGEAVSPEELKEKDYSITIKGNEITLREGKKITDRYSFRLAPKETPAHLDLKELRDKPRPGVCHAIYSLKDGELKICTSTKWSPDKAEERPQEFATKHGSDGRPPKGKMLLIFRREKE